MTATIDKHALCIIIDKKINKPLGTGFVFLKDNWIITAKHVVIEDDLPREQIELSFLDKGNIEAKVIAFHPELDIALLEHNGESICEKPLMPGYHEFNNSPYLFMCGYSPTSSDNTGLTVRIELVKNYEVEIRERDDKEIVLHFPAEKAEGGNSGGAIIGEGGNVVAIAIHTYFKGDHKYCVATSIRSIMQNITLGNNWRNIQTNDFNDEDL